MNKKSPLPSWSLLSEGKMAPSVKSGGMNKAGGNKGVSSTFGNYF